MGRVAARSEVVATRIWGEAPEGGFVQGPGSDEGVRCLDVQAALNLAKASSIGVRPGEAGVGSDRRAACLALFPDTDELVSRSFIQPGRVAKLSSGGRGRLDRGAAPHPGRQSVVRRGGHQAAGAGLTRWRWFSHTRTARSRPGLPSPAPAPRRGRCCLVAMPRRLKEGDRLITPTGRACTVFLARERPG